MTEPLDALVVGAGAAGLAAGAMLHEAGRRFLVLEARERIGGRAHSVPFSDGSVVERGGQYLHGARVATWEYVARHGLTTHFAGGPTSVIVPEFRSGEWWPNGNPDTAAAYEGTEAAFAIPDGEQVSIHDALVRAGFTEPQIAAAESRMRIMTPIEPTEVSARAGAISWHHVAPTTANFLLVDGYHELWERMSAPFAGRILLDTPVTTIDWSDAGVAIEAGGRRFEATTAILTLSIGVLQSGAVEFRPALPAPKQAAIDGLRMGSLIKLNAEFRRPFWEDWLGPVTGFWAADYPFSTFRPTFVDRPGPPVLVSFVGAANALAFSGDPERLEALFVRALEDMFPEVSIRAELVQIDIADWPADPWARGAVSVEPVGGGQLRAELAVPTPPLFWAGEAVATDGGASAVHGALSTGRRAALDALHLVRPLSVTDPTARLDWTKYVD